MDKIKYLKTLLEYIKKVKIRGSINKNIQSLYNNFGYGYDEELDYKLLMPLQEYNQNQEIPYLATGQNGYFNDQVDANGLSKLRLNSMDVEDAKFIANCFGKQISFQEVDIPIVYTTLLGTTEFNYGTQTFPAGIWEDVFGLSPEHSLPLQPIVGEKEQDYYLRLLKYQIECSKTFDKNYEQEALFRAERLINNFCKNKNRIYLINLEDALQLKASFGDVSGLRDGNISKEEAIEKINGLMSLDKLMSSSYIDKSMAYMDPNMTSEYGIALYGVIPRDKLQYIEVERLYTVMQKKAIDMGLQIGDERPSNYLKNVSKKGVNI